MASKRSLLVDSIVKDLASGRFTRMLADHCRQCSVESDYALDHAIRHLLEQRDGDSVFALLTNETYRQRKRAVIGLNSLRRDLANALKYFAEESPDLTRYIRVLFLEKRALQDASATIGYQVQHCSEYAEFLQLNVSPSHRTKAGLYRSLHKLFPIDLTSAGARSANESEKVRVSLVDYEVGDWRCRCGSRAGHSRRFDYSCECGLLVGNATDLPIDEFCSRCATAAHYVTCDRCHTRVTLDLIWRINGGGVHPSELRVPLKVTFRISSASGDQTSATCTLMELPLMLGIQDEGGRISFDSPAVFWIPEEIAEICYHNFRSSYYYSSSHTPGGEYRLVTLRDKVYYDSQAGLARVLEAVFRRTLRSRTSTVALGRLTQGKPSNTVGAALTRGFMRRLFSEHARIAEWGLMAAELFRFSDLSIECPVGHTEMLSEGMAYASDTLTAAVAAPLLVSFVAIARGARGDEFTPEPPDYDGSNALDQDGIIRIGSVVQDGTVLVGLVSPYIEFRSAEEKLLRAIFGEATKEFADSSVVYAGRTPGRVIGISVVVRKGFSGVSFTQHPGKYVRIASSEELAPDQLAIVTVSVATRQNLVVGDSLYDAAGNRAVICDVLSREEISRRFRADLPPDLIVSTNHVWANAQIVRVSSKAEQLVGQRVRHRSSGPYALVTQKPIGGREFASLSKSSAVCRLTADNLVDSGAPKVLRELIGPRSDSIGWRNDFYEDLVNDAADLDKYAIGKDNLAIELIHHPSGTISHLGHVLRGMLIRGILRFDDEPSLVLRVITDAERLSESCGPISKSETFDRRTRFPIAGGLFCQRVFGPVRDFQCSCGKHKRMRDRGLICDRCGVEVVESRVRRERMAHISLPVSVVNPLYTSIASDRLARALRMTAEDVRSLIYCERCAVVGSTGSELRIRLLDASESTQQLSYGATAIDEFIARSNHSSGMCSLEPYVTLKVIPVIPPEHRPLGSDLNDLYAAIISRSNRLTRLMEPNPPDSIIRAERGWLQKSVDALFSGTKIHWSAAAPGRSVAGFIQGLKSLCRDTLLDGLLDRDIDYSGQVPVVAGDTGNIDLALLPEELAWPLFQPVIYGYIERSGGVQTLRKARQEVNARTEKARSALQAACARHAILVVPHSGRPVALRFTTTSHIALVLDKQLVEALGWQNLGAEVTVMSLLTPQAVQEATEKLLPTRTMQSTRTSIERSTRIGPTRSALSIDRERVAQELVDRALAGSSHTLSTVERLLMGL